MIEVYLVLELRGYSAHFEGVLRREKAGALAAS
jgi:hypothetical protein